MAKARKDSKGRALRKGEFQRTQDGRYAFSYTTVYGKRNTVYAKTLAELRKKEEVLLRDRLDGINDYAGGNVTLNAMFDCYMATKKGLRDSTFSLYINLYDRYVRDEFGRVPIAAIRYSDVMQFYQDLLETIPLKFDSVKAIHALIHPTLQLAVRDSIIRNNPSDSVMGQLGKNHNHAKKKRHALTLNQQRAFLRYVESSPLYHRWLPLFTVMLGTGCRIGEIIGLRWCDIDLDNRVIHINHSLQYFANRRKAAKYSFWVSSPKTEAGNRTIPMLEEVYEAFLEEIEYQKETGPNRTVIGGMSGFIFQNIHGGVHKGTDVSRELKRIVKAYNSEETEKANNENRQPVLLPAFSCHVLRHTFCTRFCENETNVKVIQEIMGHGDIQTTYNIYTDVTEEKKKETFKRLSENMSIF